MPKYPQKPIYDWIRNFERRLLIGLKRFIHSFYIPGEDAEEILSVLRFYGPINSIGSCRARSVYLTTRLLGRLNPLSG